MTASRKPTPATDARLTEAEKLEAKAKTLRERVERDFVAQFPKVGDWLRIWYYYFNDNTREGVGVVSRAFPDQRTLCVEFDEWVTCDSCGHKKHKRGTRITYDQIIERLDGPPAKRVAQRSGS